jgi:outer membrane lipoprotein-sorting protein
MRAALVVLILSVFLSACATLPRPDQTAEAEALLAKLQAKNQGLKSFKGIGTIRFKDKEITQSSRVAWLGSQDGLLRIGILTIAGQPAASIAYNGETLYFFSHLEGRFYKRQTRDPDLEKLLSVPMRASELISLLTGRIPVVKYRAAIIEKNDSGKGCILILKSSWGRDLEKIYLDDSRNDIKKVEIFDGSLVYRAEPADQKWTDNYQIPFVLTVSGKKAEFSLSVDRYWINTSLSPDMFVLIQPE